MDQSLIDLLVAQAANEVAASQQYAALMLWASGPDGGYDGMHRWFRAQMQEESLQCKGHAHKVLHWLRDYADVSVGAPAAEAASVSASDPAGAMQSVLRLETLNRDQWNAIAQAAQDASDYAAEVFATEMVEGQVDAIEFIHRALRKLRRAQAEGNVTDWDRWIGEKA